MTVGVFGTLLAIAIFVAVRFGRTLTAVILAMLLGVLIAGGPMARPAQSLISGMQAGIGAAASAMFQGGSKK